jgi:DNA-binding LytR/AlgR family response regulator
MLKIAIVDDNENCLLDVENKITNFIKYDYSLIKFQDEMDFIKHLNSGFEIDLVFLDIILNQANGIDIAKIINEKSPNTTIVFISSNSEYHEEVYKAKHIWFLNKPLKEEKVEYVLDLVLKLQNEKFIFLENNRIYYKEICYIESKNKNLIINNIDGTKIIIKLKLDDFINKLLEHLFFRCHKSFAVNKVEITKIINNQFVMRNGSVVCISKKYLSEAKNMFTKWLCEGI